MHARGAPSRSESGFTVVELLVVVAVIAVLLGVALPAMRGAKGRVDGVALLAHQSQVFKILDQYCADHQGFFPAWGEPGTDRAYLELDGVPVCGGWWEQPIMWGCYLEEKGYEGRASAMAGSGPLRDPGRIVIRVPPRGFLSIQHLTHTGYATPQHFTRGRFPAVTDHAAQRLTAMAYPGDKGVLIQLAGLPTTRDVATEDAAFPIAFGDGHGEMPPLRALRAPVDVQHAALPVLSTEDGLLGRDK